MILSGLSVYAQDSKWRYTMDSTMVFSSPRFADLNGDGTLDVVVGAGMESVAVSHGIVAVDGSNGELLWKIPTSTQIYTSALFRDITGDGVVDVFIGGRAANYFAINGATGEIIWEFFPGNESESRKAGYLNFFGTQFIHDYNKDGYSDLLVMNSGDYLAKPTDKDRPTARLMILSTKTGEILQDARVPEPRESYYAPHGYLENDEFVMIFGTGGETVGGSLWKLPFKSYSNGNMEGARRILADTTKGFILNSLIADLNEDGTADILTAQMNATLSAVDGKSFETLWQHKFEGRECYVTPSMGQFTGDQTPDFCTIIAEGTFPRYTSFEWVVIDGATGEMAYRASAGTNQFSPGVVADMNGDGTDEILYLENTIVDPETYSIENRLKVLDIKNNKVDYIGPSRNGMSMASSPGIVDLDRDGKYEIVVVTSPMSVDGSKGIIDCIELDLTQVPIWPGYLGNAGSGLYLNWTIDPY